jgi:O-antigen/teichoic acid export membrane protein
MSSATSIDKLSFSGLASYLRGLGNSRNFRESASNSAYSVAEYIALPLCMLVAAPFLVHHLGLPQYGIWMLVSSILGSVGILSTGFGDATVKYVSAYRAKTNFQGVERTIRATLTINAALGLIFGILVWLLAPVLVHRVFKIERQLYVASIRAIEISAVILFLRSAESVFVSTLRAFECYGPAVKLNVFLRVVVVVSAVILAETGRGVVPIMLATLFWSAVVVGLQAYAARKTAGDFNIIPTFELAALREVFGFGCFSWLQALAAVVFNHADRFVIGAMLGTTPVAIYVLCVQATQPIHGLSAAGFNFLFPHISTRHEAGEVHGPRRVFRLALLLSIGSALVLALTFILFGKMLLTLWMGAAFAEQSYLVLAVLAVAYSAMAANVVPHCGLLALGRVRLVSALNVSAGVVLIGLMALLIPPLGLTGAALGRFGYSVLLAIPYLVSSRNAFGSHAELQTIGVI